MELFNAIAGFISAADSWLWSFPLIIVLLGTHLFMTIRTGFIQRKIGTAIKVSAKKDKDAEGNITNFGALATTLSATIGTGNIVGVATAIISGGPGAVFWMWLIGIFGIATKYAETVLSVKFRVKDKQGEMLGGCMFALRRGFHDKPWAKIAAACFAIFTACACLGIGGATQSNSLCGIINEYIPTASPLVMGPIVTVLVGVVILGGIKWISKACGVIVPVMGFAYIGSCIVIICLNWAYILPALKWIVVCAFTPTAMIGGGLGFAVSQAARFGAARGLFSNESGMGSAPITAANASCKNAPRQGLVIMSGAFWDTIVICMITALTLITTILANPELGAVFQVTTANAVGTSVSPDVSAMAAAAGFADGFTKGLQLSTAAFGTIPIFGPIVLTVGMVLFAYSSMVGWSWYGDRAVTYLFGKKARVPYIIVFLAFVLLGAIGGSAAWANAIWELSDIMNGLMVVPNCIAIWALSKVVVKETKHYVGGKRLDEQDNTPIPVWDEHEQG